MDSAPNLNIEAARARQAAFIAAMPPELAAAEDALPRALRSLNASPRAKLRKIYALADEISRHREAFVACGRGCASCCHMNVSISPVEADMIGAATGKRPAAVAARIRSDHARFAGVPCPFLAPDRSCGIYEHRPLACRMHSSFLDDATACHPDMMNTVTVPMVNFSGLEDAFADASATRGPLILADIRDFFPGK